MSGGVQCEWVSQGVDANNSQRSQASSGVSTTQTVSAWCTAGATGSDRH